MTAAPRTRARQVTLVVAVAVAMTVAGGLGAVLVLEQKAASSSSVVDDGPTFFEVLSQVNGSVQKVAGGPWGLFSVFGIAAQLPFSPNVIGYPLDNHTVNTCGDLYQGVTLWNGSIPVFTGTFNSGTAPFWQLAFYSNSSNQVPVATDVLGVARVYAPQPYPGVCYPWNDIPGPLPWAQALSHVTEDSSIAAAAAWGVVQSGWPNVSEPFVQIITLGPNLFDGMGYVTGGYLFAFERCGLQGIAWIQPHVFAAVNWSSTQAVGSGPGGENCAALHSYQGQPGMDYHLLFSSPVIQNASSSLRTLVPFQVAFAFASNDTLTGFYDGWGLANWMTSWNLTTPVGQLLPLATPTCRSWVLSVTDCIANSTGWYAVVLSASGEWINSYGALPGGGVGWSEPVTALVSHQQLVIVAPSSWNLSGDTLTVNSTVTTSTVLGSLTL